MEDESHGNGRSNYPTTTRESSEGGDINDNSSTSLKRIKIEHNINSGGCSSTTPVTINIPTTTTTPTPHHHISSSSNNKEQDRFLPIANVGRIMKKVIPGNGKISKDAKETVQECVSEFISFVTGEASDKCQREKRKTINGDDIIWAITTLGFEDYVAPLKSYLNKYREIEGEKLNLPKQQRVDPRLPQQQQQQLQHQVPQLHHHHQVLHHLDGEVVQQQNIHQSTYNINNNNNVYSSMSLMSQPPSFTDQTYSITFSPPTSIPKQLQQQDELDSVRQWFSNYMDKCSGEQSYLTVNKVGKVALRSLKSLESLAEADWKSINPPEKVKHRGYRFWLSSSSGKCLTVLGGHGEKGL
ncbi:unnamed protein product [Linum tenue]|uniref:Transcription factor CBF/NF-Y/archaeal histone domain-containing protein n=1 Tax=Linum tenue TaxID=586396 RepID=A0AAV0RDP4_9ROSI|nr:unnamed protein product [Linum tenue]